MKKLLEVRDLKVYYPVKESKGLRTIKKQLKAVNGISFDVYEGETFGIVGESGCGKTTTGKAIVRLLKPTGGVISFEGNDIFRKMTRGELSASQRKEKVLSLMEDVGLGKQQYSKFPHEFSGGQRQRIGVARALALNPRLIVCDEPVSALDVSIQAQILNLLQDLQKKYSLTYIFISHNLSVVKHLCDRIMVMYLGNVVELASSDQLFDNTQHPYSEALLAAIPVPDPDHPRPAEGLEGDVPSPINPPSGCCFRTRCPYADERCAKEKPVLKDIGNGHMVACHKR